MELDDSIYARVTDVCDIAEQRIEAGDYASAIRAYQDAYALLPDPREQWEAATWILTGIGDAYWYLDNYESARDSLIQAIRCPGGLGNPFVHLRLGQVEFELGNEPRAVDELARAYMGGGAEIFQSEDPRYLRFLAEHIKMEN